MITIDGTVGDAARAPLVDASLVAAGDDERHPVRHRGELVVVTDDGRHIEVALPEDVVVRPSRTVRAPWHELRRHPARPEGSFHADGHVKLKGVWLLPGEPIRVIGAATAHEFVDDTGGPREAPRQQVRALAAVAIGAGDDSRDQADRAFREVEKRTRRGQRDGAMSPRIPTVGAIVFAVAAVGLIALEIAKGRGTLGLGVSAAWLAALWTWWAVPHAPFPGGAHEKNGDDDVGPLSHAILSTVLVLPVGVLFAILADAPAKKNAGGCAAIAMLGIWIVWSLWKGVLLRPRAVPGSQVYLPRDPVVRWAVLVVILLAFVASLVLAIPEMEGDSSF